MEFTLEWVIKKGIQGKVTVEKHMRSLSKK